MAQHFFSYLHAKYHSPDEAIEDVAIEGTSHRAQALWDAANGGQRGSLTTKEAQALARCVGLEGTL